MGKVSQYKSQASHLYTFLGVSVSIYSTHPLRSTIHLSTTLSPLPLPLAYAFAFAFILPSLLVHPTLAATAANNANAHVADILAVNEILEIQINHTIADVNAVLALNKTVVAPVREVKKKKKKRNKYKHQFFFYARILPIYHL